MKKQLRKGFIPFVFMAFLFGIWEFIIRIGNIPEYIMPAPSDVIETLVFNMNDMYPHILLTVYESIMGFLISILLALGLAIVMDLVSIVKKAVYPVLIVTQTVPSIALAPLFIIWFGFGAMPKIIVVVITCFFPIVISLTEGLESVDVDLENHFMLMGATKFQRFVHLKLPFGLIHFFSGVKIAATYSVMGAVIGEWLGGNKGLGVYMTRAKNTYALDKLFAAIFVVMALSILLVYIIEVISKLCMPWTRVKKKEKNGSK